MSKQKRRQWPKKYILKKLSLHPLSPEEALRGFMQTDGKKIRAIERRTRKTANLGYFGKY